ncbi:hypothetical protein J4G02_05685 [Candidatus Poribacteria bacterium]|nr:hypothetical protein [Candidatus Poribacteria bacterium]
MNKSQSYDFSRFASYAIHDFAVVLITLLLLFGGTNLASAQAVNEEFHASTNTFLRRLASAKHLRLGDNSVSSISGTNALNSNPAGLSFINSNRLVTNISRFPRTVAIITKLNDLERYEDHNQYALRASGLEVINYSKPLDAAGGFGFDFAVGHEGRFSRVNHLGKATNSFPETDFAVGVSYAVKLFRGFAIGADARWLRSKVQDAENNRHIGHGYAYNLGLIQQLGESLRIGAVIRNLSNGLSFTDNSIPDRIRRDVLLGGSYQFHYRNVDIQIGLDLNPPFEDGVRTNFGGTVWYRDFIGGRIGYLRHIEKRFGSVLSLETGQVEFEDRLWKTEGLTLGLGLQISGIYINVAYTPQIRPTGNDGEQVRIENGKSVYSFSIEQRY